MLDTKRFARDTRGPRRGEEYRAGRYRSSGLTRGPGSRCMRSRPGVALHGILGSFTHSSMLPPSPKAEKLLAPIPPCLPDPGVFLHIHH